MSQEHSKMSEFTDEIERRPILSDSTPIRIGLVLGLLGVFGAWIWWAATISSKLDNITSQQAAEVVLIRSQSTDIESIKAWRLLVDTVGSPSAQRIEREVSDLRKDFELHKAESRSKP